MNNNSFCGNYNKSYSSMYHLSSCIKKRL